MKTLMKTLSAIIKRTLGCSVAPLGVTAILFIAITGAAQTVWNGTADTTWYTSKKLSTTYTITTAEELAGLAALVNAGVDGNNLNGSYNFQNKIIKLGANIQLNNTNDWENWETNPPPNKWMPIGVCLVNLGCGSFLGTFDAQGYVISGMYIGDFEGVNNPSNTQYRIGLFGNAIGQSVAGPIKNLGLEKFLIKNSQASALGAIAAYAGGKLENSYAIGNIISNNSVSGLEVGGLCANCSIENSFFAGKVEITNPYSGISAYGLNGRGDYTQIEDSYYDKTLGGDLGDFGITTADFATADFLASMNVTAAINNKTTNNYLGWQSGGTYPKYTNEYPVFDLESFFASGDGSAANPYLITDVTELKNFEMLVNKAGESFADKTVVLGANIALNSNADIANFENWGIAPPANSWKPIGATTTFKGTFDGAGHVIKGVYIKDTFAQYVGFFGRAGEYGKGGIIKNLGLENLYIDAGGNVGGILGNSEYNGSSINYVYSPHFTVQNSYVKGTIKNSYSAGGLCYNCNVDGSYFSGVVNGKNNVGGLVAYSSNGYIKNSYSEGTVKGEYYVSGLNAYQYPQSGKIINSYSTATVIGNNDVGGLALTNYNSCEAPVIENSYFAGKVELENPQTPYSIGALFSINSDCDDVNNDKLKNSYYDNTINNNDNCGDNGCGAGGISTTELQSEEFVNSFNKQISLYNGESLQYNGWIYEAGKYPVLSEEYKEFNLGNFFASGDGSAATPYLITNENELYDFADLVNVAGQTFEGKTVALGSNITLSKAWEGIGFFLYVNDYKSFNGTFDGAGHIIKGLNKPLFVFTDNAVIRNLGLEEFNITGYIFVNQYYNDLLIENSYAIGKATGSNTGGATGICQDCILNNSYLAAEAKRLYFRGDGENSFYNRDLTEDNSYEVYGRTTLEMQSPAFAQNLNIASGVSTNAEQLVKWSYEEGKYPRLTNQYNSEFAIENHFAGGDGSAETPWLISNETELRSFAHLVNTANIDFNGQYIKLTADISLNDTTDWQSWTGTTDGLNRWLPIGNYAAKFKGSFDGDGHIISGMYLSNEYLSNTGNGQGSNVGLFGYAESPATISNLGVKAFYLYGTNYVGGIIAEAPNSKITIDKSFAEGNVNGRHNVGGLCGYCWGYSTISNSYFAGTVALTDPLNNSSGGLVGYGNGDELASYSVFGGFYSGEPIFIDGYSSIQVLPEDFSNESYYSYYGFDFVSTWGIGAANKNNGAPYLLWESPFYKLEVASVAPQEYTGSAIEPKPAVTLEGVTLVEGEDFEYIYENNIDIVGGKGGPAKIIVKGIGDYFGEKVVYFAIVPAQIAEPEFPTIATIINYAYSYNLTLGAIQLPNGYAWETPSTLITATGEQEFNVLHNNPNYAEPSRGLVTVNILKGIGSGTVSITGWTYGDYPNTPVPSSLTNGNVATYNYTGTTNAGTPYSGENPPTEAGLYTITATFAETSLYSQFVENNVFEILRAEGEGGVTLEGWRFGSDTKNPVPVSATNGIAGVTYIYQSTDESYPPSATKPSNPGSYTIKATFPQTANYKSFSATNNFIINNADATPIEVVWTEETEFTYNKMVQVPFPSVKDNPEIELIVLNGQAAAGEYKGPLSALAIIKNETQRRLYDLQNNTMEYSIVKKDIVPRFLQKEVQGFEATDFEATEDTVYVSPEIYENDEILTGLLYSLAGYTGFAIDTVSGIADDITALSGELGISLVPQIAPLAKSGLMVMAKSVAQGESKLAKIDASKVRGKNYGMSTAVKNVVIAKATDIAPTEPTDPVDYPEAKEPTNINKKVYIAGNFKFWQSNKMLHLDLGQSFSNDTFLEVRNLKGQMVLRQAINKQISSVSLPTGVFAISVRGTGINKSVLVNVR